MAPFKTTICYIFTKVNQKLASIKETKDTDFLNNNTGPLHVSSVLLWTAMKQTAAAAAGKDLSQLSCDRSITVLFSCLIHSHTWSQLLPVVIMSQCKVSRSAHTTGCLTPLCLCFCSAVSPITPFACFIDFVITEKTPLPDLFCSFLGIWIILA